MKDRDVVADGDVGDPTDLSELSDLPDETPSLCVSDVLRLSAVDKFHH